MSYNLKLLTISAALSLFFTACKTTISTEHNNKIVTHKLTPLLSYSKSEIWQGRSVPLWANGAPGFEDKKDTPETAKDWWVRDIHNPSLAPYLPTTRKSRAAIIVVPGGGHKNLVFPPEAIEPAKLINEWGISAFALKYRLARQEGSPYAIEAHAGEDLRRAVKWLRANAEHYDIDPDKIGVLGFSAGGELVNFITYNPKNGRPEAQDPVERQSDRPDFIAQVYPGPLGVPENYSGPLPPAFFLTAGDDDQPAKTVIDHYALYQANEGSVELHILAEGGHGFNLGTRSELKTVSGWPERLRDWLTDQGYIEAP